MSYIKLKNNGTPYPKNANLMISIFKGSGILLMLCPQH